MNKKITSISCLIGLLFVTSTQAQITTADTIYVDPSATGASDGSSWADAYNNIVSAVGQANTTKNTDIWVKQGTYVAPTASDVTFITISHGVHLYGGFNGTETSLSERDPVNNPTILSGDVAQNDLPILSVSDAISNATRSENTYTVIQGRPIENATTRNLKIDGFTISGGNARSGTALGGYRYGGGVYVNPLMGGQSPEFNSIEIENCIFENNSAASGSAIISETDVNFGVLTIIENCIFRNNYSYGAIAYCYSNNNVTATYMTNCLFTENTVDHNIAGLVSSSTRTSMFPSILNVINTTFSDNHLNSGNLTTVYAPPSNGDTTNVRLNMYNSIINEPDADILLYVHGGGIAGSIEVRNNIINTTQANFSGNYANIDTSNNIVGQSPGFVGGGNFELAAGSAALNHGLVSDYEFWYNQTTIPYTAPTNGLGEYSIPTSGNMNAGAYQNQVSISVGNELEQIDLKVFPNPTNSVLNIVAERNIDVKIINVLGKTIASQRLTRGNNVINVSDLKSGIYFLQAGNKTVKFMKE